MVLLETGVAILETENSVDSIRFKDIHLLIEVLKTKSLRELSRKLGTSPGQISKAVRGLEQKLGVQLLNRSLRGIEVTAEGADLLPHLEEILSLRESLRGELKKAKKDELFCVASTSFISTHLLPQTFAHFQTHAPSARFRLIDLPPSQFVPVGLRNGFQVCIHIDALEWPRTWTSIEVGDVKWELYCRADHAIAKRPGLDSVLQHPFVYPVYWSDQGIRFGDDGCPTPIRKRIRGYETVTATAAAEVVRHSDQLGFLPNLVMQPLLNQRLVRKLSLPAWKPVKRTVYLTVKNDVKQSVFLKLKDLLQRNLLSLG